MSLSHNSNRHAVQYKRQVATWPPMWVVSLVYYYTVVLFQLRRKSRHYCLEFNSLNFVCQWFEQWKMDACLLCNNFFVKVEGGRGYNKRYISKLTSSEYTALGLQKNWSKYQVQKILYRLTSFVTIYRIRPLTGVSGKRSQCSWIDWPPDQNATNLNPFC